VSGGGAIRGVHSGGARPASAAPPSAAPPSAAPLEDEELVARVSAGETELFEILMRRHNQRLFRVARSITGDDALAEDVMQEAYVRAYGNLGQFTGRARFSTWLARIAVHEALASRRRGRRLVGLPAAEEEGTLERIAGEGLHLTASRPPSPEEETARGELRETLRRAVDALPASLRVVFVLREVERLSTAETAAALDLGESAVKVRLHRARRALRDDLERRIGGASEDLYAFYAPRCDRVVAAVMARVMARVGGAGAASGAPAPQDG
jgi:RNA polymerase sigma-70 factor (ECF subfamily)